MSSKTFKITEEEFEEKIKEFQEWIEAQADLPQNIDKIFLARYLKIYNYRLDKAQKLLKQGMSLRHKYPNYFFNRDPNSPEMQTVISTIDMVPLLKHTPENYKVCIYQLLHNDTSKFIFEDLLRAFFMGCDVRFVQPIDNFDDLESGEVVIFDMKNLSLRHLTKIDISSLRLICKYLQDCQPSRIIKIHIINCTPLFNKATMMLKPFLHPRIYNALCLHNVGKIETLYEYVPRDILPIDYGGTTSTMEELKKHWLDILYEYRPFLINDNAWRLKNAKEINDDLVNKKYITNIWSYLTS